MPQVVVWYGGSMSLEQGSPEASPSEGSGKTGAARMPPQPHTDAAHSEGGIFSILSQYALMQVILAATGLVRNKVVAYRLGPTAFGELTQIGTVLSVVGSGVCFGVGVSLSRNVAVARSQEERGDHFLNANAIVLALSAVAVVSSLALLATGDLLRLAALKDDPVTVFTALLFILALPIGALQNNYLSFLQGILDVRRVAVQRSTAVLLATVISVPLVWFFGFVGAAIQYFLITLFVSVLLGWRCRALGYSPLGVRLERRTAGYLATFGIMSMASGFAQGVSDTAVRTALIEAAGAGANGLLQAPYTLATVVKTVVLASIGSISLATIASKSDSAAISASVDRLLNVVIPIGASALGLLGLLAVPAMTVLYSRDFVSSAAYFPYVFTADILMAFVWVIGAPLLSRGDRGLWLVLDPVFAATRWGVAGPLLPRI